MKDVTSTRFLEFHQRNPEVYAELVKLARRAKSTGFRRIGIRMLWEVMRWNLTVLSPDGNFKLNDHYHSRYARLMMQNEPDLRGLFELRPLRSE